MDGMIFAAGLGTRLGSVGQATPKALIEVGGQTMLERAAHRLVTAGADRLIVNVHHQAERIVQFIAEHDFGAEVHVSHEPDQPLETGGGLLHARPLFRGSGTFLLYNVDVITDADLAALVAAHEREGALATLAVNERDSSRRLLFDAAGLFGREDRGRGLRIESRPPRGEVRALPFAGIHACSPKLLDHITEHGVFSIRETYLRLAAEGQPILPWSLNGALWLEIGDARRLEAARAALGPTTPA
jgi:N-acetyl-alpha-D-muramate 1-phosphate uridylyltransferase